MSYTLRGRLESRLAALVPLLALACALAGGLHRWWPVELALLMAGVGLALDLQGYDRLLAYQPGWLALPLGLLELGATIGLAKVAGIGAPLLPALALFGGGWLVAQLLAHAGFPLLRLSYAEDGGELGRVGALAGVTVAATALGAGALALAQRPPVVHLEAGVHPGPLVITRRMVLQGERGAVVRGGIVVRHDDVTIRDVGVVGGENGIEVDGVDDVLLDGVSVSGAELDGIHVRRAGVEIRDCTVDLTGNEYGQGIDISFGMDKRESTVSGCTITGGQEGIVTHMVTAHLMDNRISRTTLRAIAMTEMSMGMVSGNEIRDAKGVGILCNDHSMCMIERNVVVGTRADGASDDLWRQGHGVLVTYDSEAELRDNELDANPHPLGVLAGAHVEHE